MSAPVDARVEDAGLTYTRGASLRIVIGALLLVVGLVLMISGAETSGGRSPAGAIIAGLLAIGSGLYEMAKAEAKTLQHRVDEALNR